MTEAEPPKGKPENPLTREDVLRLRNEFLRVPTWRPGQKRAVLDFSGKSFVPNIDLAKTFSSGRCQHNAWDPNSEVEFLTDFTNCSLPGALFAYSFLNWTWFRQADLRGADFRHADLREASFVSADLRGAKLSSAKLEQADFSSCKLRGALLEDANITDAKLEYADWSPDYKIGDEMAADFPRASARQKAIDLDNATNIYRRLKHWYTSHGMYDVAGEFFYREMECQRKQARQQKRWGEWLKLGFYRFLFGYGERPWRVAGWAFGSILFLALAYSLLGGLPFLNALYFSTVSFTAVGYGFSLQEVGIPGWAQGLAAVEALWGVVLIALFLTTFVRKMTR